MLCIVMSASAQNVNVNPGGGTYPTLKDAFDAINAGSHTGTITVDIVLSLSLIHIFPDDDRFVKQVRVSNLPDNWRTLAGYPSLQKIGSDWYKKRETLLLKVPSAVIPLEYNFVINTEHPGYEAAIKLTRAEDCFWDERLI